MEDINIDNTNIEVEEMNAVDEPMVEEPKTERKPRNRAAAPAKALEHTPEEPVVGCLRKETVIVRYVKKESGLVSNPNHVLYGGLHDNASITYVVPKLNSGTFVNILTDSEKRFLEECMGLEYNELSVYKKENNFWDDSNPNGINKVKLGKSDTRLDLSVPADYIKYKILLANKKFVAPNLQALHDYPKATYRYVLIHENETNKRAKLVMNNTMECYKEFGKIEDDIDILRMLVEILDGRPTSPNVKLDFLQTRCDDLIKANASSFLRAVKDPYLRTKATIKKAIEAGIISQKGNYLYLREDSTPLCEHNEEPTLNFAAKYLNMPKHQDVLFAIQAKLNSN